MTIVSGKLDEAESGREASFLALDNGAGGRKRRLLVLADGRTAVVSLSVRTFKRSRQSYGYMQFKIDGKTVTRYVGKVTAEDKSASLKLGWKLLRHRKLAESNGWQWHQ
ncbi:MAG: hypothetical protein CVU22_07015 [Betaproteobacteria bacterium HGW-Betaproteobacteria-16]|nr:MAG: hypothetical protein CVU22_07015 [Betaproteobacteria bacterium HGW-Betaproteobacteria-16]